MTNEQDGITDEMESQPADWLTNAIQRVFDLGVVSNAIQCVHDGGETVEKLVDGERITYSKPPVPFNHRFTTFRGFVDYLNLARNESGIVFVGENEAVADLSYLKHNERFARLSLTKSEEYRALEMLFRGVGQKELWRLLIGELYGCIPPDLLLAIGQVKISGKGEATIQIDTTGVTNTGASESVSIAFQGAKGEQIASIPVDYRFTGRVYECFDTEYVIDLRMIVGAEKDELTFKFVPRRLQSVLLKARTDLVDALSVKIDGARYSVHEGAL